MFSFNDKLFGLLVKDMEAMDPSILKGETGASKKQKVGSQEFMAFPGDCRHSRTEQILLPGGSGFLAFGEVAHLFHLAAAFASEKTRSGVFSFNVVLV